MYIRPYNVLFFFGFGEPSIIGFNLKNTNFLSVLYTNIVVAHSCEIFHFDFGKVGLCLKDKED